MVYLWSFVRQTTVHKEMARESGKLGSGTAPFTLRFRLEAERAAYLNTLRLKLESTAARPGARNGGIAGQIQLAWEQERVVGSSGADDGLLIRCGAFELFVSDETR